MNLKYRVKFYDYWHLSSGLSSGSRLDSSVVKGNDNLPFIPGKTIKGLLKESAKNFGNKEFLEECFGLEKDKIGACYFTSAFLEKSTQEQILQNNLEDNLYDVLATTKIDEFGIAADGSLREIEVVIPVSLYGEVKNLKDEYVQDMIQSLKSIKRMGLNRNRGLGRCEFIVEQNI